tara:strand:- start:242 stop:658 length:417 start_codon:yes stop_codon:yes gene_type:complete
MTKSSSKKLSILDAKYWFKDRCSMGVNGSPLRGPGLICSLYLISCIFGLFFTWSLSIYKIYKNETSSRLQLTLYTLITGGWSLIALRFMYSACYICNGIRGFILVFTIGLVINSVLLLLFGKLYKEFITIPYENKNVK